MSDLKISQLTAYTTPLDADLLVVNDTANSTTKKTLWSNIKATLKTYFDTLYSPVFTTSAGLASLLSDETGSSGGFVRAGSPTITTPTLDTPVVTVLSSMQHTHASAAQGGQLTDSALSAAVGISKGGTGQTAKAPAFDALQPMTTGGDLIYGGASGAGTRLANGVSGQVLTSGGGTAAPTWTTISNKLFASTADVQVNNTAADTNLLSVTIPANTMGTSDGFKARLFFSAFHTGASTAMDLKVKYGGTTMNTITFPASGSSADKGYVDIYILGAGGTSAQESYVDVNISADNLTTNNTQVLFLRATSNGTATVDSTSAQTFAVSIDPVSAQANQDVTMTGYVISKL